MCQITGQRLSAPHIRPFLYTVCTEAARLYSAIGTDGWAFSRGVAIDVCCKFLLHSDYRRPPSQLVHT